MPRRSHVLVDPTSFEEPLLETTISVVVDDQTQLISVNQLGLGIAGSDVLLACITAAKNRRLALGKQMHYS
jgi:exosome complex component RRP43